MFKKIVDKKNLEKAYLFLSNKMEEQGIAKRYSGWDGLRLKDIELNIESILYEISEELLNFKELEPAILINILKKNKLDSFREIYTYNLKERIKAQAIYQVLEPFFDKNLNPWLFSYRLNKPAYFAARSFVKQYKKNYEKKYVIIGDLVDYTNLINHKILKDQINNLDIDEKTKEILYLFIGNKYIKNGEILKSERGLIIGTPVTSMFANLYLNNFDKFLGPKVQFYRRVGDDFIVFDENKEKLKDLFKIIKQEIFALDLKINEKKSIISKGKDNFNFLGYNFNNGIISLKESYCDALVKKWKQEFPRFNNFSLERKRKILFKKFHHKQPFIANEFSNISRQKNLANNEEQLKSLSEAFFRVLTSFFFSSYSPRNRRLLTKELKNTKIKSLYKYFIDIRYNY